MPKSGIITEKGMKGRFAFQKEAFKRGLAVSEPIIIKKEGDKIIWKEREARGENIEEYYESTRYHNEIKPTSEKHLKQLIREEKQIAEKQGKMEKAYGKEIRKIIDFYKEKQTLGEVRGMTDYLRQNAIYNEKTGKVTFTDLGTELIKKKKKN